MDGGPGELPGSPGVDPTRIGGAGAGVGAGEGRLFNVHFTVAFADGRTWRRVPAPAGMVTIVPCGYAEPALVTVEALDGTATYYDEGTGRTLPLPAGYVSRAMVPAINKSIGVTPYTEAAYQYAQNLTRAAAAAKGAQGAGLPAAALAAVAPAVATKAVVVDAPWQDAGIVSQANTRIGEIVTDQLPGLYRATQIDPATRQARPFQTIDITRLPKVLTEADAGTAGTLPDSDNGRYGAILAGLAKAGATALPDSATPALQIRHQLVADLADGMLDRLEQGQAVPAQAGLAYTYATLWSNTSVGTGQAAVTAGTGALRAGLTRIASTGQCVVPRGGYGIEYAVLSDGRLVKLVYGAGAGMEVADPVRRFATLKATGACDVIALASDGRSFSWPVTGRQAAVPSSNGQPLSVLEWEVTSWDGLLFSTSDGRWWRSDASQSFVAVPTPAAVTSIALVPVLANVNANDPALASTAGDGAIAPASVGGGGLNAGGGLQDLVVGVAAYGLRTDGRVVVWRWGTTHAPKVLPTTGIRQITTDGFGVYGLTGAGDVYWLNANEAVVKQPARGNGLVYMDPPAAAAAPGAAPLKLAVPEACWIAGQYVRACDGRVFRLQADIAWACKLAVYGTQLCGIGPSYQNVASNVGMYGFTGDPIPLYVDESGLPVQTVTATPMTDVWRVADAPIPPVYGVAQPPRPVFLRKDGVLIGVPSTDFSAL